MGARWRSFPDAQGQWIQLCFQHTLLPCSLDVLRNDLQLPGLVVAFETVSHSPSSKIYTKMRCSSTSDMCLVWEWGSAIVYIVQIVLLNVPFCKWWPRPPLTCITVMMPCWTGLCMRCNTFRGRLQVYFCPSWSVTRLLRTLSHLWIPKVFGSFLFRACHNMLA